MAGSNVDPFLIQTVVGRGTCEESRHSATAIIYPQNSAPLLFGTADRGTFLRSVAKPFQALALLRAGIGEAYQITPRELAVICSSHAGEELHRDLVKGLLEKGDLAISDLQCGIHAPFSRSQRQRMLAEREPLDATCNNCSGKHSGMLLAALNQQQSLGGYLDFRHPLQRAIRAMVELFSGEVLTEDRYGVDGCGAPTYHMSLLSIARAFQRLHHADFLHGCGLGERVQRVHDAIDSHPKAFSGEGRYPLLWRPYLAGKLRAKEGAEGVMVIWGKKGSLVIKSHDGADRGLIHVIPHLLKRMHWIDETTFDRWLADHPPRVRNVAGKSVGEIYVEIPEPLELEDPLTSVPGMGLAR